MLNMIWKSIQFSDSIWIHGILHIFDILMIFVCACAQMFTEVGFSVTVAVVLSILYFLFHYYFFACDEKNHKHYSNLFCKISPSSPKPISTYPSMDFFSLSLQAFHPSTFNVFVVFRRVRLANEWVSWLAQKWREEHTSVI